MKKSILIAITATVFFVACKKRQGCTNPSAFNYNEKAKKDDGSCLFESKLTFWYGKTFSDSILSLNGGNIVVELGGLPRSMEPQFYKKWEPECGNSNPGLISFKTKLGKNDYRFTALKINCYSNNGMTIFTHTDLFYKLESGCKNYELKF